MSTSTQAPRAITMWDFSWLERRWPGAGYEDWDRALDELAERGYDAVRIDAYPHLVDAGPERIWTLEPLWTQMSWGAQSRTHVQVFPALVEFIAKCRDRGIMVALSSWYRQDADDLRRGITTPARQAEIWISVLQLIDRAGLLDSILYVDLCNEFPNKEWSVYLYNGEPGLVTRTSADIAGWMRESIEMVRAKFPSLDYTYSFSNEFDSWRDQDVTGLDLLELHVWMANASDFNERVGYRFDWFAPTSFDNLVANGRRVYEADMAKYDGILFQAIDNLAEWSRATSKPVYTTEAWSIIDYKDWPGLDWDWVLDLNAKGVSSAASTGRWAGIATSNFCGPQFVGMWREVAWHQRLTSLIKSSSIDADIQRSLRA